MRMRKYSAGQFALLPKLISPKCCPKTTLLTENSRAASFRYVKAHRATDSIVCKTLFGYKNVDEGASTSTVLTTKATLLTNVKMNPYFYQVSTLAHMLGIFFGGIPLRGLKERK